MKEDLILTKNSWNMKYIRSKNTKIELIMRAYLWHAGFRYRKNYSSLPGKPDIVLTKYKIAIFCDGDFFHGNNWDELQKKLEKGNNPEFWIHKIERNMQRDRENDQQLRSLGWTVVRLWETDIKKHPEECLKAVEEVIFDKKIHKEWM